MGAGKQTGNRCGGRSQAGGFVRQLLLKLGNNSGDLWLHAESICRDEGLGLRRAARRSGQGGSGQGPEARAMHLH